MAPTCPQGYEVCGSHCEPLFGRAHSVIDRGPTVHRHRHLGGIGEAGTKVTSYVSSGPTAAKEVGEALLVSPLFGFALAAVKAVDELAHSQMFH